MTLGCGFVLKIDSVSSLLSPGAFVTHYWANLTSLIYLLLIGWPGLARY